MFGFIKQKLQKIFNNISAKLHVFWSKEHIDEQTLNELELILLQADTGIHTTRAIISKLKKDAAAHKLINGQQLRSSLEQELVSILSKAPTVEEHTIYLLVGINGSGKTTLASKLAHRALSQGKRPLLVAADTFRAAAIEQLEAWSQRAGCEIIAGKPGQDPASVVFEGAQTFAEKNFDVLIIDTAGRLQTKTNLMAELAKIKRMIERHLPNQRICTLLTVDAMLGQNSFEQAKLFHESTQLDGIVLTKMDSTGKGGIIFSITQTFNIPVVFLSFGEHMDQLKVFNTKEYVQELLG